MEKQLARANLPVGRRVRCVIFDLDGTLTPVKSVWQHIHEALGTWESHGSRSLYAFLAGEISYGEFARRDVDAWRGVPRERIERIVGAIPYRPGAKELVSGLKERGVRLALLSSGLDVLAARVATELGFELWVANELSFTGGVVDGRVHIRVPWDGKPAHLDPICHFFRTTPAETAAIGDSHGDAPLFARVGLGVAEKIGRASCRERV